MAARPHARLHRLLPTPPPRGSAGSQLSPCGLPVKQFQARHGCQPWGWPSVQPLCMYTHQTHAGTHVLMHTHDMGTHAHACSCTLTTHTRAHACSCTLTHGHQAHTTHAHSPRTGTHYPCTLTHTGTRAHTTHAHSPPTLGLMHPLTHTGTHLSARLHTGTHVESCSHGHAHAGVI